MNPNFLAAALAGVLVLAVGLAAGWYAGENQGVSYATISLVCGATKYTVSTGNNKGNCQTGGNGNNAICDDGKGNSGKVQCDGGCQSSAGSGSCTAQ
jgi:hypothetical protein